MSLTLSSGRGEGLCGPHADQPIPISLIRLNPVQVKDDDLLH